MQQTATLRRALVALTALAIAVGGLVAFAQRSSATSPAAAPVTYSVTIAGTDMHSLDPAIQPMFVNGGGVFPVIPNSNVNPQLYYFEAGINLPVGAKVTSVQALTTICAIHTIPSVVFGSYQPATGNTVQSATLAPSGCAKKTFTKTGNPITTTVAGRRYAIDFAFGGAQNYPGAQANANTFWGATIKYTCTSPCVP